MDSSRSALQNEKETYTIYRGLLGEDHEKTREASECLKHLTQQAVVLQKKMNEIYTGKSKPSLPPIQVMLKTYFSGYFFRQRFRVSCVH